MNTTMIENVDYATIIFKEYRSSNNTWYLTFKNVKTRAKVATLNYFAHPFAEGNQMQLIDDVNMKKPLSVENISEQVASTEDLGQRGRQTGRNRRRVEEMPEENMKTRAANDIDDDLDTEEL